MVTLIYEKGIWLDADGKVIPFLFFKKIEYPINSINILNEINFLSCISDLDKIESVVQGQLLEYEVSSNMITFDVQQEITTLKNFIFNTNDIEISTSALLNALKDKRQFIDLLFDCSLKDLVAEALINIAKDPLRNEFNSLYTYILEEVYVSFKIEKEAFFKLNIEAYINSIMLSSN